MSTDAYMNVERKEGDIIVQMIVGGAIFHEKGDTEYPVRLDPSFEMYLNKMPDVYKRQALESLIHRYGLEQECYYAPLRTKELFHIGKPYLDALLVGLCPKDTAYLQQIIHPGEGRTYYYTDVFADWVFTSRKKERLYEITDETP